MPGIYDDRESQLVFNDYLPGVSAPWIAVERRADEMCRGGTAQVTDMVNVDGIGWTLRSYMMDPGDKAYLSAAAPGYLSVANGAQVPANYKEENAFLKQSGTSYAAGVQGEGSPMISAQVPAGTSEADASMRLGSDESAFPSPNPADDAVAMVRKYAFPGVPVWNDLLIETQVPGSVLETRGVFETFMFDSAPGVDRAGSVDPQKEGTGHYAGKMRGDGRCYISEKLVNGNWVARFSFVWDPSPQSRVGEVVGIRIHSRMWIDATGKYHGDRIAFNPFIQAGNVVERALDLAILAIKQTAGMSSVYKIPRVKDKTLAASYTQTVRVDLAQGCRAIFAVSKHVYVHTGTLVDDFIPFDQAVSAANKVFVYLNGVIPTGTSFTIAGFDQDGAALTASATVVLNTDTGQTAYASLTPTARMRGFRLKVTATANADNTLAPILSRYEVDRSPEYQATPSTLALAYAPTRSTTLPALPKTTVESFSMVPQETDPGAENATFVVDDLTGELAFLGQRNLVPVLWRTKQGTAGVWGDIFRGYVLTPTGERMRGKPGTAYASGYTRWTLQCGGEWVRTNRTLTPARKTWGQDPNTGTTFRVTDVIRYQEGMTYPTSMIDVPDVAIPLLSLDPQAYMTEANARVGDANNALAQDYLGAYMVFDESAGDKGMRRLLQQKHAPYNNLVVFETDHPSVLAADGVPRIPHFAGSYPDTMGTGAQVVKHVPILCEGNVGFTSYLEPAEGNLVVVHGSAIDKDANGADAGSAGMVQQFAADVGAYNFLGLSPGATGYPDGSSPQYWPYVALIRDVDFKIGSQRAADWKTRRIFEKACFTRFFLSFMAPLVLVTDVTDAKQQRPRRLKYYDAVQVRRQDGTLAQFIVLSCSPAYRKDSVQMARYTLVTQANINTIGAIGRRNSPLNSFLKAMGRADGTNWTHTRPHHAQSRQGEGMVSNLFGLPTPTAPTIQDLDPNSPTFGQFKDPASYMGQPYSGGSMAGFDAIPHA